MFHTGSISFDMDTKEAKKFASVIDKQDNDLYQFLSEKSVKPPTYWKEELEGDRYLFPEEALELGLCHKIL